MELFKIVNLARAVKGLPDVHVTVDQLAPGIFDIRSATGRSVYVAGMGVDANDLSPVLRACSLYREGEEHDPEANGRREAAGKAALEIRDTMIRARTLDAIDGWAALMADPSNVVERTDEGTLCRPPEGVDCLILVVRCPSTARIYAIRVPNEFTSVHEARRWVMQGLEPEVET